MGLNSPNQRLSQYFLPPNFVTDNASNYCASDGSYCTSSRQYRSSNRSDACAYRGVLSLTRHPITPGQQNYQTYGDDESFYLFHDNSNLESSKCDSVFSV
jgi:hypothetical protein